MKKELLQPAATITASILAVTAQKSSTPLPKDAIQKAFVHAYRQLELAQLELEKSPPEK